MTGAAAIDVPMTRGSGADRTSAAIPVSDSADRHAIRAYLARQTTASFYHQPEWLEIIHRAFGQRTMYLTAATSHGLAGVLPLVFFSSRVFGRFAVSLPFLNYGGIVADGDDAERALLARAIDETRRAGGSHLELRHTTQRFQHLAPRRHKVAMRLDLAATADAQWTALDRKVRNQVRKAEKSGLSTRIGGRELVPAFYDVFARNMRDLGTPVYGVRFFEEITATFPDAATVCVVSHGERALAASIVLQHGSRMEVPWASALRESNPLSANVLLYWEMLKLAVGRGVAVFDFGRSTPGEGTYHFKRQWGATASELVWEYWLAPGRPLPDLSPKNAKFGLAIRAWQRLPLVVANTLGPHIVRHLP